MSLLLMEVGSLLIGYNFEKMSKYHKTGTRKASIRALAGVPLHLPPAYIA